MKVNLLIGAAYAYACIKYKTGSMDVRLEPGRSAAQSLRESATSHRVRAAQELTERRYKSAPRAFWKMAND